MDTDQGMRTVEWGPEYLQQERLSIEDIDGFDARGKQRVYGLGIHFGATCLSLDAWWSRDQQLFVRFSSKDQEVDWYSYRITGMDQAEMPDPFDDRWIPVKIRDEFETWLIDES